MQKYVNTFITGLTITLFACGSSPVKEKSAAEKLQTADSVFQQAKIITGEEEQNTCIRGQAEPVIKKEVYPNASFALQPDGLTGIETVNFDNGDKLIIHNQGCEYYVLIFRFETSRFEQDTAHLEYWFKSVSGLMTGILPGLNAPIDIKAGINQLDIYIDRERANNYKNLQLGEEIDFGINEIRNFVTVDRIEQLADKKYALTVSFAVGPL